jgi:hypothetical protein
LFGLVFGWFSFSSSCCPCWSGWHLFFSSLFSYSSFTYYYNSVTYPSLVLLLVKWWVCMWLYINRGCYCTWVTKFSYCLINWISWLCDLWYGWLTWYFRNCWLILSFWLMLYAFISKATYQVQTRVSVQTPCKPTNKSRKKFSKKLCIYFIDYSTTV